jgi:acyl carrier protein
MKRSEFLNLLDDVIEAEHGTVTGSERLIDIPKWDSLAVLSLIAAVDSNFRIQLSADSLAACQTVADLEKLLDGHVFP